MDTPVGTGAEGARGDSYASQAIAAASLVGVERGSTGHVYVEHAPLLRRIAIRKFQIPPADAESLVHDVFITYLVNPSAVRSNLRGYLIAAICNASRNYWRSHHTKARVFDDSQNADDVAGDDLFEGLALHLVIGATLAKLRPRCREVIRRYYLDGEDTATIATAMNTTPSNVNYLMHVCRKCARRIYDEITRVP